MVPQCYEEIDHIADIALRVWGEDFYSLLRHSAQGMYDLMKIKMTSKSQETIRFQIADETLETMLVDFLSEILYLIEEKKKAFETFSFRKEEGELVVRATGYQVEQIEKNIKAVTFHDLDVVKTKTGLETTITFDV
jgi:SHS2 domain-containing protein